MPLILNYQFLLEEHDPQRTLYLAIPADAGHALEELKRVWLMNLPMTLS